MAASEAAVRVDVELALLLQWKKLRIRLWKRRQQRVLLVQRVVQVLCKFVDECPFSDFAFTDALNRAED